MFSEQLSYLTILKSPRSYHPQCQNKKSTSLDFQYEICSTFLKHTGERLHSLEAELIFQTNEFLANGVKNITILPEKNVTLETAQSESCILNPESSVDEDEDKLGTINRKKIAKMTAKRSEENTNEALQDVEKHCSITTYAILTTIITEYRKLQNRIKNIQSRENLILKKQQRADRYHEDNIMLKTKLQTQNKQIALLNKQLHDLKQKNKQILDSVNQKIELLKQNCKFQEINNKVYRDIKTFLNDKELYTNSRMEKIQCIQSNLMQQIQKAVTPTDCQAAQACQRCCEIMKKIKSSIMNYKDYLEMEAQQMEKLYLKHKKTLFTSKQTAST